MIIDDLAKNKNFGKYFPRNYDFDDDLSEI